jgi:dolichyl-phosphate beta-glucosyltransferase
MQTRILLVIPCYNEYDRLDVNRYISFAKEESQISFLFVDDGSLDNTKDLLNQLLLASPDTFDYLVLPENQGKAEAVRRGVIKGLEKSPKYIGYWDADLATPLEEVSRFMQVLRGGPHS